MSSNLKDWVGRSESQHDIITAAPVAGLSATLDWPAERPAPGTLLPPVWHWMYFLPMAPQASIGPDGHPVRGGFLPPIDLPRRMWAGSQIEFHEPLRVGDAVTRQSSIVDITEKSGRSGALVFVKVHHRVFRDGAGDTPAIDEFQDIVYRPAPEPGARPAAPKPAPTNARWERVLTPDEVLLFRYSALTFNGHRIHYDRPYVTGEEGYPGLVVHGPLQGTLLLDLLRRELPEAVIVRFDFRAVRPAFDGYPLAVCGAPDGDGRKLRLWTRDHEGAVTMEADVVLAS